MKIIISFICLSLFSLLYAQPKDVNGWQKVTWGMSMEKVAKLYNLTIENNNRDSLYLKCYTDILGDKCEVTLHFDDKSKLKTVIINHPERDSQGALRGLYSRWSKELTTKYGEPLEGKDTHNEKTPGVGETEEKELYWSFPSTIITLSYYRFEAYGIASFGNLSLFYEKKTTSDEF